MPGIGYALGLLLKPRTARVPVYFLDHYHFGLRVHISSSFLPHPENLGHQVSRIIRLWENAWAEFVPFLGFDKEIRQIVCTTSAIESVNSRIRKAVKARGHFPNEHAALKCVYLAAMALGPTGKSRARWTQRWKAALNAFDIRFDGLLSAQRG